MREIKFRAWVDGFLPEQTGMFYGVDLLRNTISGGYDRINAWRNNNSYKFKSEEEPFILMQYTGLKDRNGVEIYEGDIVNKQYHNLSVLDGIGVVEMGTGDDSDGWAHGQWLGWKAGDSSLLDVAESCEVIGNIYENKELLG